MILNEAILKGTTKKDKKVWCKAMDLMLALAKSSKNGRTPNSRFECHSICRAIAKNIRELRVVTGYYVGASTTPAQNGVRVKPVFGEHSWLITQDRAIIDPYPVGFLSANPVLVIGRGKYACWGSGLYIPNRRKTAEVSRMKGLSVKVKLLSRLMKQARRSG